MEGFPISGMIYHRESFHWACADIILSVILVTLSVILVILIILSVILVILVILSVILVILYILVLHSSG